MRYRLMASYLGASYQAAVGPTDRDVTLFAAPPPPEEHGFSPVPGGIWRKYVRVDELDALWESRPIGSYHGEPCLVLDDLGDRLHIVYLGMDERRAGQLGYWQVDRGVFEVVVARHEVTDLAEERHEFPIALLLSALPRALSAGGPAAGDTNGPGVSGPGVNGPGVSGPGVNGPGVNGQPAGGYGAARNGNGQPANGIYRTAAPGPQQAPASPRQLAAASPQQPQSQQPPQSQKPQWGAVQLPDPQQPPQSHQPQRGSAPQPVAGSYPVAGPYPGQAGTQYPSASLSARAPLSAPPGPPQALMPSAQLAPAQPPSAQPPSPPAPLRPTPGGTQPGSPQAYAAGPGSGQPGPGQGQPGPGQQAERYQQAAAGQQHPGAQPPAAGQQHPGAQPPAAGQQFPGAQPPAAVAAWHGSPAADGNGTWYYQPAEYDQQNSGFAQNGTVSPGAPQNSTAQNGAASKSAVLNGAVPDGAVRTGAVPNGTRGYLQPGQWPRPAPVPAEQPSTSAAPSWYRAQPVLPVPFPSSDTVNLAEQAPVQAPRPALPAAAARTAPALPAAGSADLVTTGPIAQDQAPPAPPASLAPSASPAPPAEQTQPVLVPTPPSAEQASRAPAADPGLAANPAVGGPLSKLTGAVRGRRAARKPRLAMSANFADLVDLARIPRSAYAVDDEVTGAMCLFKTDGGYEVFSCAEDARHEVRFFEEEEAAYFYLFGVLAAEALRSGRLSPHRG